MEKENMADNWGDPYFRNLFVDEDMDDGGDNNDKMDIWRWILIVQKNGEERWLSFDIHVRTLHWKTSSAAANEVSEVRCNNFVACWSGPGYVW